MPLLPLWAFMVCFRARLTFIFITRQPVNFRARLSSHRIFMRRQPFASKTLVQLIISAAVDVFRSTHMITKTLVRSPRIPQALVRHRSAFMSRLLNTYRRCGGACWLHLQYRAIREPQISQISVASLSNKSSDFLIFNSIIYSISMYLQFLRLITD